MGEEVSQRSQRKRRTQRRGSGVSVRGLCV